MKMKVHKNAAKILITCLAILSLSSCSSDQEAQPNANTNTNINSDQATIETYKAQIEYYSALIEDLQNDLLKEKEENFIAECEYKLKIDKLEESIKVLSDKIGTLSTGKDPTSGTQSPSDFTSNSPSVTNPDPMATRMEFRYTENKGEITITGYTGNDTDIVIPPLINGLPVVKIEEDAFKNAGITSVSLPSTLKEIGWFAFSGCTTLQKISIPSSVTSVGYGAFDLCPPTMVIVCEKGSYISAFAASWGLKTVQG